MNMRSVYKMHTNRNHKLNSKSRTFLYKENLIQHMQTYGNGAPRTLTGRTKETYANIWKKLFIYNRAPKTFNRCILTYANIWKKLFIWKKETPFNRCIFIFKVIIHGIYAFYERFWSHFFLNNMYYLIIKMHEIYNIFYLKNKQNNLAYYVGKDLNKKYHIFL